MGSGATTRALIVRAATDLFARDGYDATTVRKIAHRCQITDPALYYHFRSKREILDSIWHYAPEEILPVLHRAELTRDELAQDIEDRFLAWTRSVALLRVLLERALGGDERATRFRQEVLDRYRAGTLPSARRIYGEAGDLVVDTVLHAAAGLLYDTMLRYGDTFTEVVGQDSFRRRLRRLIEQALPCPHRDSQP